VSSTPATDPPKPVLMFDEPSALLKPNGSASPVKILIVDDEQKNLTVLETVLSEASYGLIRATSAQEALLALIAHEFALLILDINMPDMSGFELAHLIRGRKKSAHVPIIFLTAYYNEDSHVIEGYGTGAVDYLHKPVNPLILRSKVAVFVDLYQKTRELAAANRALVEEVTQRRSAEQQLSTVNETLEQRIVFRTQELAGSEARYRQLADSMPQMVWTAWGNGCFDYFNARLCDFTGFGPEQLSQLRSWAPFIHPDDLTPCLDAWTTSVTNGKEYRVEFRLLDRRTQRFGWYLGRALPVRDAGGEVVKWFGTWTDIEDQKRLETGLRQANQALEQFAYAASHDLREPLRNIAAFTALLQRRCAESLGAEGKSFVELIVGGARRMSQLVDALTEYMQSTHPSGEPATEINVEAVLKRVLANLHQRVQESRAEITYDELPHVRMAAVHLEQLLQNLLGNALKYKSDTVPPRIQVSAWRDGADWHFSIRDNGIGMEPAYTEKIFGVFKRLHGNGDKYAGTGIGLAICKSIVERYEGRLWVESALGQGSTFHFTIPSEGPSI
jgi:PAS domain S-box-containing protein